MHIVRLVLKVIFALFFIGGGVNHFINTAFYVNIMPPYLPWHTELVYISGVVEIVLGIGLLIPKFCVISAWGLVALLVAVFPANLHMYLNAELFPDASKTGLLVRLPLQLVFIFWAYRYTKRR